MGLKNIPSGEKDQGPGLLKRDFTRFWLNKYSPYKAYAIVEMWHLNYL